MFNCIRLFQHPRRFFQNIWPPLHPALSPPKSNSRRIPAEMFDFHSSIFRYRHICLRNESGQPLLMKTLFVHITVKDYVPDGLSDLADALANPIAYQSILEKHAQQLMALTDDLDEEEDKDSAEGQKPQLTAGKVGGKSEEKTTSEPQVAAPQRHTAMNGTVPKQPSVGPASPKAQDTVRKPNQTVTSVPDENQEKPLSLLESEEANVIAESLEDMKEHKLVVKVISKMEKELQILRKKHERILERETETLTSKEAKLRNLEYQNSRTHNRFVRKFYSPFWNPRRQPKRRGSRTHTHHFGRQQDKAGRFEKKFQSNYDGHKKEQYNAELEISSKYQEPVTVCSTQQSDATVSVSASTNATFLTRQRGERADETFGCSNKKEEMKNLSKKHKDKNELSRIKKESFIKNLLIQQLQKGKGPRRNFEWNTRRGAVNWKRTVSCHLPIRWKAPNYEVAKKSPERVGRVDGLFVKNGRFILGSCLIVSLHRHSLELFARAHGPYWKVP
ncbi:1-phosphatidylinositol 4,5-bisphosphate phosphodiesterase classes I and II [Caerostris extrusa]|uniref:1-phosphatidylinositol 4,5-bisphosphate phosphodiesterase classes I and II n=1 Tax=Caerostris extrusa TaxID=172846 RepID=A0AAV4XSV7_CAEEX|nr:1-phosphatidylinositol 4,5-bisphosphate phosphodiesterase classes I and II [Caerostris extrusa]